MVQAFCIHPILIVFMGETHWAPALGVVRAAAADSWEHTVPLRAFLK